jgi:hypothetical protein
MCGNGQSLLSIQNVDCWAFENICLAININGVCQNLKSFEVSKLLKTFGGNCLE